MDWELHDSTGELYALLSGTNEETRNDELSLKNALREQGFDDFAVEEGALETLLKQISEQQTGRFLLAQRKDAEAILTVSDDAMRVTVTTTSPKGGEPLTETRLKKAVEANKIRWACCLPEAVTQVLTGPTVEDLLLAEGTPMQRGADTQFVPLVESVVDVPLTEDATGRVNFREILEFCAVEPGTELMHLQPPSEGTAGTDVYGRTIPAEPGNTLTFPSSTPGAKVHPDNPDVLIADINGHPLVLDNCVHVDEVLTLDAVDVATGDVNFGGSVLVKGDVESGAKLTAKGDIVIKGLVDKATIRAGHNIEIGGGVFGEEVCEDEVCEFSAHLTAGGSVSAGFMSAAFVSAAKVVSVREYIAHCKVHGKRGILIGQEGGKGVVFGGQCRSDVEVVANVIGTDANVPTTLSVGYPGKLRKRYNDLQEQLSKLLTERDALQKSLQGDTLDDAAQRKRIANTLRVWNADIARISKAMLRTRSRIEALENARVIAAKEIHPNTLLEINGRRLKIRDPRKGGVFTCRGREIELIEA